MLKNKIYLASDNWAPAHPLVMQAIVEVNTDSAPSYGADSWTEEAQRRIQDVFKKKCTILFVPSGTGANILGLKIACRSHESIICTDCAHIHYQESGAAEALIGCKLLTVPHQNGKIDRNGIFKKKKKNELLESILRFLAFFR
jgi:threonine aldolase